MTGEAGVPGGGEGAAGVPGGGGDRLRGGRPGPGAGAIPGGRIIGAGAGGWPDGVGACMTSATFPMLGFLWKAAVQQASLELTISDNLLTKAGFLEE